MKTESALLLCVAALAATGCNSTSSEQAKQIGRLLGVPVSYKAAENDNCLWSQFDSWESEWKRMSSADKARAKAAARGIRELVFLPTRSTRLETGTEVTLYFDVCSEYGNGNDECQGVNNPSKTLKAEFHAKGGPARNTTTRSGGTFTFEPHSFDRKIPIDQYWADSMSVYDSIDSLNDPAFKSALAGGHLQEGHLYGLQQENICGSKIPLMAALSPEYQAAYETEVARIERVMRELKTDHDVIDLDAGAAEEDFVGFEVGFYKNLADGYRRAGYPAFDRAKVEADMDYWNSHGLNESTVRNLAQAILQSR